MTSTNYNPIYVTVLFAFIIPLVSSTPLRSSWQYFKLNLKTANQPHKTISSKTEPYKDTAIIWSGDAPANTKIKISCKLYTYYDYNCQVDRFYVSLSGDDSFQTYDYYCGEGTLNQETVSNKYAIAFYARPNSYYYPYTPFFSTVKCTLTATSSGSTNPSNSGCKCDKSSASRVVNGTKAAKHEYPFMVGITGNPTETSSTVCGGSLISDKWVITAAHCAAALTRALEDIHVIVGDYNMSSKSESNYEQAHAVGDVIIHTNYNSITVDFDIALLRLKTPVQCNEGVQPICLPCSLVSKDLNGETVTVIGWGTDSYLGDQNSVLHEAHLLIIGTVSCKNAYANNPNNITKNMLCTYKKGSDACQGDSGGPLIMVENGVPKLVGIVSWGEGCAHEKYPGVHTRVTNFITWIEEKTGQDFC